MAEPTSVQIFGSGFTVNTTADTFTFDYANDITRVVDGNAASDGRAVLYGLLEKAAEWYDGIAPELRPAAMRISRSGTLVPDGLGGYTIQRTFTVVFKTDSGPMDLLPEA